MTRSNQIRAQSRGIGLSDSCNVFREIPTMMPHGGLRVGFLVGKIMDPEVESLIL